MPKTLQKRLMTALSKQRLPRAWSILKEHPDDIDINIVRHSCSKWHPLHYAVSYKDLDLVKYLIEERNADVNIKSRKDGTTPLMIAAKNSAFDICKMLIDAEGADLNVKNSSERTALHFAAENNLLQLCLYLIRRGANVNEYGKDFAYGKLYIPPIVYSYQHGNVELFKWFCYYGAIISIFEETKSYFRYWVQEIERKLLLKYIAKRPLRRIMLDLVSVKMVKRLGNHSMIKMLNVDVIQDLFEMLG
jgi:ankyrin repeat protein